MCACPWSQSHRVCSKSLLTTCTTPIFLNFEIWNQGYKNTIKPNIVQDLEFPSCPIPEWPDVSTAVPKNRIYSVTEACKRHMLPIHPPAFMKIHCMSSSGRMCPGYFLRRTVAILSNAVLASEDFTPERYIILLSSIKKDLCLCKVI